MIGNDEHREILRKLAEQAGLICQWQDHLGRQQTVSSEVLQKLLEALELSAATPAQCRESLDYLVTVQKRRIPSLTTGRSDRSLVLPEALQGILSKGDLVYLLPDDESEPCGLRLVADDQGRACLPAGAEPGYYTLECGSVRAHVAIAPPSACGVRALTGKPHSYGLAAQIYSLRKNGDGGIGNFSGLEDFARSASGAGAEALAISPVHALFSADKTRYSPYAPSSRLFLNALYIDPAQILGQQVVDGCISELGVARELEQLEQSPLIDWPAAARLKLAVLRCIWDEQGAAIMAGEGEHGRAFQSFCQERGSALQQHAAFEAIHGQQFGEDPGRWHWHSWPENLRHPDSAAVKQFVGQHRREVGFHAFLQWLADEGLARAHKAGRDAGMSIGLIADLAIGTDSGGSHAWSRQTEMLNGVSVGAPPDMLNHRGQNWGLTSFSPRALMKHDYQPFLEMLRASLRHAGGLRIDHVLGLRRLWLIPEGASATEGAYLNFPQRDLLNLIALESWRHRAIIIGEDLGTVPENFRDDIASAGVLGMQVLWFERDNGLFVDPSRWRDTAMATTTTHDLPTVAGWWRGRDIDWSENLDRFPEGQTRAQQEKDREQDRNALWAAFTHAGVNRGERPAADNPKSAVDSALAFVAETPSPLALIPVEDIVGLDEQPNLPGTLDEHPNWRRRLPMPVDEVLTAADAQPRLRSLSGRKIN